MRSVLGRMTMVYMWSNPKCKRGLHPTLSNGSNGWTLCSTLKIISFQTGIWSDIEI